MKIGVLTSGGDSSGMNACITHLAKSAKNNKVEIIGIRNGYQGLIDNNCETIEYEEVKDIFFSGGSIIKCARSLEFLTEKGKKKAAANYKKLGLSALIIIGGNGSMQGAYDFIKYGVNCIFIPGTIDNDVYFSEKSLGFDTAINNATQAIDNIQQTMRTHQRACVIEVMGRHCGDITLNCAVASSAELAIVPEKPFDIDEIVSKMKKLIDSGVNSPTIIISENIIDNDYLANYLQTRIGKEVKSCILGYVQRGGSPTAKDRMFAMLFAVEAMKCIKNKKFGVAIGIKSNKTFVTPLVDAISCKSNFNDDMYEMFNTLNGFKS